MNKLDRKNRKSMKNNRETENMKTEFNNKKIKENCYWKNLENKDLSD